MKKILGVLALTMVFVCCDVSPRQSSATNHPTEAISTPHYNSSLKMTTYKVDGMEYRVFSIYEGGLCVVNHTKEKLEVELLEKQLLED